MSVDEARLWLVNASLMITGALFLFFLLAPTFGYPLLFEQARNLLEILLPVFLGYLGSAAHFLFRSPQVAIRPLRSPQLLRLLLIGSIGIFTLAATAAIIAFGVSNRAGLADGHGMSLQDLTGALSLALGLLTVSTNVIAAYLFSEGEKNL